MTDFQRALDGAIELVRQGQSLEEALAQYPQYSTQLKPLLTAAMHLGQAAATLPGAGFKARGRAALEGHMALTPRRGGSRWLRLAASLAVVTLTLAATTTAMAQSALPGQRLHSVKLYSEQVWRSLHSNPIQADLQIAQRRLEELLALEGDAERVPAALGAYASALDVLRRDLEALPDRALSAQQVLHGQREQVQGILEQAGSTVEEVFTILPTLDVLITANPVQVPLSTPVEQMQLVVPTIPTVVVSVGKPEEPVISVGVSEEGVSLEAGKTNIVEQIENAVDSVLLLLTPDK